MSSNFPLGQKEAKSDAIAVVAFFTLFYTKNRFSSFYPKAISALEVFFIPVIITANHCKVNWLLVLSSIMCLPYFCESDFYQLSLKWLRNEKNLFIKYMPY